MCIHAGAFDLLQWVVESKIQNEFKILLKMNMKMAFKIKNFQKFAKVMFWKPPKSSHLEKYI